MKNILNIFAAILLASAIISCQSGEGEGEGSEASGKAELTSAKLEIFPVKHGSLVLTYGGKTIYIDPAMGGNLYRKYDAPDLLLITHPHGDHCSPETLKEIETANAVLIMPTAEQVAEKTKELAFKERKVLANGEAYEWEGIKVEAVPMYNLPNDDTARHPKGWGNGYVLTIGGERIYISGDTEDIPEMRNLQNIDKAFVCMNLPYTMSVDQAIDAVLAFQPKTVYPYHYRGQDPEFSDVEYFKKEVNKKAPNVEVKLEKWY